MASVKQLISGGSASKSTIAVGDCIIQVDGHHISTLPIEQVTDLILGPEGSTVTMTGIATASGVRYSPLIRGDARHALAFEHESKDAIHVLNNVHRQACEANGSRQGLEDKLAAAILKISASEMRSQELEAFLAKATERCVMCKGV